MSDIKHPGGRPLLFETPEALQKKIDDYLEECRTHTIEVVTEKAGLLIVSKPLIPTIADLASYLGCSRETIYNYEEKDKFFDTIKKIRDYILGRLERGAVNNEGNVTGIIWLQKNYGYTDRTTVENIGDNVIKVRITKDENE